MSNPLLELKSLKTHFPIQSKSWLGGNDGIVRAVDGVSFALDAGEVLGLVGESGCGKSTLGRSILQLIRPTSGSVQYRGKALETLKGKELRSARKHFQMIFQDPHASLNPRMTVESILTEAIRAHEEVTGKEALKRVCQLMEKVGLARRALRKYPHEFSGGQRQRIAIARALAVGPELIVADEPVSALDVSIQAQILNLLKDLRRDLGLTLIFISHDLSVVRYIADKIAVMYLGKIVEHGPAKDVIASPLHPYTKALISAVPIPDPARKDQHARILLKGDPPSPLNPPKGCAFHPRCPVAEDTCRQAFPDFTMPRQDSARAVACHLVEGNPA